MDQGSGRPEAKNPPESWELDILRYVTYDPDNPESQSTCYETLALEQFLLAIINNRKNHDNQ